MNELGNQDFKDILSLGEIAISCKTIDELQHHTLLKILQIVDAESSVYFDVNHTSLGWQFVNGISYGVPKKAPKTWCDHYQTKDPFTIKLLNHLKIGGKKIITSDSTINHSDYVRTKYYCEFLRPQSIYHMMTIGLHDGKNPIGLIGLHRTSGSTAFSTKDISKIDAIVPYLSAAIQRIKLSEMVTDRREIIKALSVELQHEGVMILDKNLFPTFLDEKARHLLKVPPYSGHELTHTINNYLPPEIIQCCQKLSQEINASHDSRNDRHINFTTQHYSQKIIGYVYAYKVRGQGLCFLVCFKEQDTNLIKSDKFSQFNLTRREIDIVHLVSVGMTNPEISDKLFISVRTVQNHLRSIYSKVKVHNRTSLVSRLI
jgi:DNA-binding CsgD family transcriptional regulator